MTQEKLERAKWLERRIKTLKSDLDSLESIHERKDHYPVEIKVLGCTSAILPLEAMPMDMDDFMSEVIENTRLQIDKYEGEFKAL